MTLVLDTHDLINYAYVKGQPKWEKAMLTQVDSLLKNRTQDLVRPQVKNIVKCQWIYKIKFTSKGVIEHHKVFLVVKGFSQQECIDYTEGFSLVAK